MSLELLLFDSRAWELGRERYSLTWNMGKGLRNGDSELEKIRGVVVTWGMVGGEIV